MLLPYLKASMIVALLVALTSAPSPKGKTNVFLAPASSKASAGTQNQSLPGQSETVLPDGNVLLTGGEGPNGPIASISIRNRQDSSATRLAVNLNRARAWHTATVLPDGTVFVFGGIGQDGQILQNAEIFDPRTSRVMSVYVPGLLARSHHTATVLTDARLLFVGGVTTDRDPASAAQIWDPRSSSIAMVPQLGRRKDHRAILQADGTVFVWGGSDQFGNLLDFSEIFDPSVGAFRPSTQRQPARPDSPSQLAASLPEDMSQDVPISSPVMALRFSRPVDPATVNFSTVSLSANDTAIPTKVVGVEEGALAFVTPATVLTEGTTYTVTLSGLKDWMGTSLPQASISFTTVQSASGLIEPPGDDDVWVPDPHAPLSNRGKSGGGKSANQSFPPLQGKTGETALAGQALRLNGEPLKGVTLSIDGVETQTDVTGRFLLAPLTPGHHAMLIDGTTANRKGKSYGVFEAGVDLVAAKTTVLGYTIWMTGLDTVHAVTIPSPTNKEVVIKTPTLPGLELHIPPHTVITDHDGKPVTKITITPIPIDQPPFPLPVGVQVPTYFTIQPGSAYIKVEGSTGPQGAQLFYPNVYHFPFGTNFNFYNYDPDQKGWYIYGHGKVSSDASQVVPDTGTVIYEFTGAMVSSPGFAPPVVPKRGTPAKRGEPVDLGTGLFTYTKTDLSLRDTIPLVLTRTYRQADPNSRAFGIGATHPYDMFLVGDLFPYTFIELVLADGSRVHFDRSSPCSSSLGGSCSYSDATYVARTTPDDFYGATIQFAANNAITQRDAWILTKRDGTVYTFPDSFLAPAFQYAAVVGISDRNGNAITLTRDSNHNLTKITSPNGRSIQFVYDSNNRITTAQDSIGRKLSYVYDTNGCLSTVTDINGGTWQYTYDANCDMLTITDPRNILYLTNQYDGNGRVSKQTNADSGFFQFAYTLDTNGSVTQTTVTDPRGFVEKVSFNSDGYEISDTRASGQAEQQGRTYNRMQGSGLILSETDALNRQTTMTYDPMGNLTSITNLAGSPNAATTFYAYEPAFSQLTAITDPQGHTTTFSNDNAGNLVSITSPSGNSTTFAYNLKGQVLSVSDPAGGTTQYTYNSNADLTAITDPLGRIASGAFDAAGRLLSVTDPLGNTTTYSRNAFGQISGVTDSQGNQSTFTYDGNGNLLTVVDAANHTTTYTYDNMDRVSTRKDPLLNSEAYQYDLNGNLSQFTDRRGKVSIYNYDGLNRRIFTGFGKSAGPTYESTVTNTYDAGSRLTQIIDSLAGTITRTYDGLDDLTSESSALGSSLYSYDKAGRRNTFSASGQQNTSYGYDSDDNVISIIQGSTTVSLTYDNADRRATLTLPDGIIASYSYDAASQITGLVYKTNAGPLGNLTYGYDLNGRIVSVGGSYANTGLPNAVTTASYNANNQVTTWGTANLFYDANGNMTSDGTHAYAWDARNHLTQIDSGATGSFIYDPFGRRITKTVTGVQTGFVYDFANPVQELSGSVATANSLIGGTDEIFQRTDSAGARSFITELPGSVVGLADTNGTLQTTYSFDPFGNTTRTGSSTSNSFAYTGRELDATGLYFNRARYYSPQLQRFVSEDPIGFQGGDTNLYSYVHNSPITHRDPIGFDGTTAVLDPPVEVPGGPGLGPGTGTGVGVGAGEAGAGAGAGAGEAGAGAGAGAAGGGMVGRLVGGGGAAIVIQLTVGAPGTARDEDNLPPGWGRGCNNNNNGDDNDCDRRYDEELRYCHQEFRDYPNLRRPCLERAYWRRRACRDGLPDPGPLDPMDPDWSTD